MGSSDLQGFDYGESLDKLRRERGQLLCVSLSNRTLVAWSLLKVLGTPAYGAPCY
jgi:hypothetical protein